VYISVLNSNFVHPPGNQLLDGIDPNHADRRLALIVTGASDEIDLRVEDHDRSSRRAMKYLRPLERNVPAGGEEKGNGHLPGFLVDTKLVNVGACRQGMKAYPLDPASVIRQTSKCPIEVIACQVGGGKPDRRGDDSKN